MPTSCAASWTGSPDFDHKVHLVLDGHSGHHSRRVRAWLADHPDRIELHFLLSYSPELNPRRTDQRRPQTEPSDAQPGPRPGPTRRRDSKGSSTAANASHTSSAATSAAHTSATSPNRTA
ncbi:transposase [Streptomyces flavusporus]|uniref:transposase n=1 Tax=Streptomyces flavusporus TaxID=3385496 RepID=UPI003D663897